ncbi:MAG: hypothetical protein NXI20_02110 [bacterium]|nr:hypothetical protein [bacterium]
MKHINTIGAILEYGIDSHSDHMKNGAQTLLELNHSSFYESLYVSRTTHEDDLKKDIMDRKGPFFLQAPQGYGKTSMVGKVLSDIEAEYDVVTITIDLKSKIDSVTKSYPDTESIRSFVISELEAGAVKLIKSNNIHTNDIISFFFEGIGHEYLIGREHDNTKFTSCLKEIKAIHDIFINGDIPSHEWYCKFLREEMPEMNLDLRNRLNFITLDLSQKLNYEDLLFFLANYRDQTHNFVVIAFDNLDSMKDGISRTSFFEFIRVFQNNIKESTKMVMPIRPVNLEEIIQNTSQKGDEGAFPGPIIHELDYTDFQDKEEVKSILEKVEKQRGRDLEEDEVKEIVTSHGLKSEEVFASKIIEKRFDYCKEVIKSKEKDLKHTDLDELFDLIDLINSGPILSKTLNGLCNHDRRRQMNHVRNFCRYFIEIKGKLSYDKLDSAKDKQFVLETFLYKWIVKNQAIVDTELYSLVDCVKGSDSPSFIKLMLLNCLVGLSIEPQRNYVTVKKLVKRLSVLGVYDEKEIFKALYTLLGDSSNSKKNQLIELRERKKVSNAKSIRKDMKVSITPRGIQLSKYTVNRFTYQVELLRKSGFMTENNLSFDEYTPVNLKSILGDLLFLAEYLEKSFSHMVEVGAHISEKYANWLDHYIHYFNVSKDKKGDNQLDLFSLIHDHRSFLETHNNINKRLFSIDFINPQILQQYETLSARCTQLINIIKTKPMVSKEDLDLNFKSLINRKLFE